LRRAAPSLIFVSMKTRSEVVEESRRKGVRAGAVAVASIALGVVHAPVLAVGTAAAGAWLGWRWWKHRAENGIKF
jgi:hypothetical protein